MDGQFWRLKMWLSFSKLFSSAYLFCFLWDNKWEYDNEDTRSGELFLLGTEQ